MSRVSTSWDRGTARHPHDRFDVAAAVSDTPHFMEMKRYIGFTEVDAKLLHAFRPHAEPHFEMIVRSFYERTREHQEAHEVFESERQIDRLHKALIAWLGRILTGPYDKAYCTKSARTGEVHVRIGLPQRYMFTAINLFRVHLQAIAFDVMQKRVLATFQALSRILDLELAIMNQIYRTAFVRHLERLQERAPLGRVSERHYRSAIDLADIFLVGIDETSTILQFDTTAERLTGYRANEVLGNDFVTTFLVEGEGEWSLLLAEALAIDKRSSAALPRQCFTIRTRNGRLREIQGQLCHIEEDNNDVRILLVARDITNEHAAKATRSRTERLAAIGTMATGLAHEIRNPLNGAQLHLTYMKRTLIRRSAMPDLLERVDQVSNEVRRLSALVKDFLDFTRNQYPGHSYWKPLSTP